MFLLPCFHRFFTLFENYLLKNLNNLHILYMKARGSMGEHERCESLREGLDGSSVFLSAKTLNVNLFCGRLHWFNANNLISVQADAFRHSKCRLPHTCREESLTKNVRLGGVA